MFRDEKPEGFDDAEKKASDFVNDKAKAEHLLVEAIHKADREKSFLGKINMGGSSGPVPIDSRLD